jgi:hypothetical protein
LTQGPPPFITGNLPAILDHFGVSLAVSTYRAGAAIQPGQRLAASSAAGRVRALRTVALQGVRLAEDAPVDLAQPSATA